MRAGAFAVLMLMTGAANAGPKATDISFTVSHDGGSKKYPNQLKESYQLGSEGKLHYSAYFGGMPIDMNHNDSADWASGESGKRVLSAVTELLGDPKRGLRPIPDSESAAEGAYSVTVRFHDADSTRVIDDKKSEAWKIVAARFGELIAAFEKATGRPKTPNQLSQHSR